MQMALFMQLHVPTVSPTAVPVADAPWRPKLLVDGSEGAQEQQLSSGKRQLDGYSQPTQQFGVAPKGSSHSWGPYFMNPTPADGQAYIYDGVNANSIAPPSAAGYGDMYGDFYDTAGASSVGGVCSDGVARFLKPVAEVQLPEQPGPPVPIEISVVRWAMHFPVGQPFVTDGKVQVDFRYTKSKGASKGLEAPYLIIIKPKYGKGNVSVFLKKQLVMVDASTKTGMEDKLLNFIEEWTTTQSRHQGTSTVARTLVGL